MIITTIWLLKSTLMANNIALVCYDEDHNFFVETPTINRSNEEIITHKVEYNTFIELLEDAKNSLKGKYTQKT